MLIKNSNLLGELIWKPYIILVAKGDDIPASFFQASLEVTNETNAVIVQKDTK